MGRALLEAIAGGTDLRLTAALERPGSPYLKKDAGELIGAPCNVQITDDLGVALKGSDVLSDRQDQKGIDPCKIDIDPSRVAYLR